MPAAFHVAHRCLHRLDARTRDCLHDIRRRSVICQHVLMELNAPGLAQLVQQAAQMASSAARQPRHDAFVAVFSVLPDAP